MARLNGDVHLKDLLFGGASSLIIRVFGVGFSYLTTLYIARYFGAQDLGTLTLLITIVSIFCLIPKFGMNIALVRIIGGLISENKLAEVKFVIKIVFLFSIGLAVLFSLLLFFASDIIANSLLNKNYLTNSIKIIAIAVIANTAVVLIAACFQGISKIKSFVFVQSIITQAIFLGLLLLNHGLKISSSVVVVYTIATMVSSVLALVMLVKVAYKLKAGSFSLKEKSYFTNKILPIAYPMLLASSFAMLMAWTDIIMLGFYTTEEVIGVYSAAQKTAVLTSLFLVAVNSVAAPKFAACYAKNDLSGLAKIAQQSTKIIFLLSLLPLSICFLAPSFVMGLFGNEFIVGAMALVVMSIGQFVNAACGSVGLVLNMTNHQKTCQNIIIFAAIVNIIANYCLIPIYGINGAALATTISVVFWNIAMVFSVRIKLGFWTLYISLIKSS